MKITIIKSTLFAILAFSIASCSSDDSSSTVSSTSGTTTTTPTSIQLTAQTMDGEPKQNYILMLFDQPVSTTNALPPILKQVTTNAQGLGLIDMESLTTTTPKTFYVEAFVMAGGGYVLKSITHPQYELQKGSKITSAILVN